MLRFFQIEEQSFFWFRRALRRTDQRALDDLFNFAQLHTSEAGYAAHAFPMEIYLLSMFLEEHKIVMKLRKETKFLRDKISDYPET